MKYFPLLFMSAVVVFSSMGTADAQYVSVAGGRLFPQSLSASAASTTILGQARADFSSSSIITADGGFNFFPYAGLNLHYSYAKPEVTLRRADAVGSLASADVGTHTLTLDLRVNTPQIAGFRVYGFGGAGISRFNLDVKRQIGIPFPNGIPGDLVGPVGTFGGGLEKHFFPLVAAKFEVRDYITPIPSNIYVPGGSWHRVAVVAGIRVGR